MNRTFKEKSVTLIELVIGIAILGIIILAISQLDLFSNASIVYAQRRTSLSNEASMALEHISKHLTQAIGDWDEPAAENNVIDGDRALFFYIDGNGNHMRDAGDTPWVYRWTNAPPYLLRFCDSCGDAACDSCIGDNDGATAWGVVVARHVLYFGRPSDPDPPGQGAVALQGNYATIEIQTCQNPAAANCGTTNNPQVDMQASIRMPSYSSN